MALKIQYPLSYTQQWATIYLLIAGNRPLSDQEILGLLTPWLSGKLKTSQLPAVKSVRVSVKEDPDVGPVISSAPFINGTMYQAGSVDNNIVTAVKWNLQHPSSGAITDEIAGNLRAGFRSTGKQTFERLGFKVLLLGIQQYGQAFTIPDYGIVATPELPAPTPIPTSKQIVITKPVVLPVHTPQSAVTYWMIGATALIFVALMTKKINGKGDSHN